MPLLNLPAGPASVLFGIAGGLAGFFIALALKNRIPGRFNILISASIAGIVAELLSGALGELTGSNVVVLTARLIGLFAGGSMFRFAYRGHFGSTKDWMGPYLASSFASWTAFAMSLQLIGIVSILSAVIGGFLASSLSKAISRYLPSTLEQASAMAQVTGLSWIFGFAAYAIGIAVAYIAGVRIIFTPFGIFAASSVALLLSFMLSLPYVTRERVYARLTARMGRFWKYLASFILLFLFLSILLLVGYQKAFTADVLLIALAAGLVAGVVSGSLSYYLSNEKRGIPPETFSGLLLGVSSGQGIGVIASISLDTFVSRTYPVSVIELVLISGLAAAVAGFLFAYFRARKPGARKQPAGESAAAPSGESDGNEGS